MLENPLPSVRGGGKGDAAPPFQVLLMLVVVFFLPFLDKASLFCGISLNADPPGKHLHRDTFSYLNEQSARL